MNCEEILELLPLYLEDMLDDDEKKAVGEHLDSCKKCQEELEFLRSIRKEMAELPEIEVPSGFVSELHKKLILEKQKKKINVSAINNWKNYLTVAASAAIITISVVALNTDFYKMDEGALSGKANNVGESVVSQTEIQESHPQKTEDTLNETLDYDMIPETSNKKSRAVYDSKITQETEKTYNEAQVVDAPKIAEPEVVAETETDTVAFSIPEMQEETSNDDILQDTYKDSGAGGATSGGGSRARNIVSEPRFDKIVFRITAQKENENLINKLVEFSNENGEYKLPLDLFYKLTGEFIAIPDSTGYYTSEGFTEEYNELLKQLESEAVENKEEINKRILEIEEICRFGYIVVE